MLCMPNQFEKTNSCLISSSSWTFFKSEGNGPEPVLAFLNLHTFLQIFDTALWFSKKSAEHPYFTASALFFNADDNLFSNKKKIYEGFAP